MPLVFTVKSNKHMDNFKPSGAGPIIFVKSRSTITFFSPLQGSPSSIVAPRVIPQSYFLLEGNQSYDHHNKDSALFQM
jgi:hypothetical protein